LNDPHCILTPLCSVKTSEFSRWQALITVRELTAIRTTYNKKNGLTPFFQKNGLTPFFPFFLFFKTIYEIEPQFVSIVLRCHQFPIFNRQSYIHTSILFGMDKMRVNQLEEGMILAESLSLPDGETLEFGQILSPILVQEIQASNLSEVCIDNSPELLALGKESKRRELGKLERRILKGQEFLFLQGDISSKIYLLLTGELEVIYTADHLLPSEDSPNQNLEEIRKTVEDHGIKVADLSRPLTVLGEMGPLLFRERSTSIRTLKNTVIAIIPAKGDEFQNTLMQHPKLGINIAIGLARRMEECIDSITMYQELSNQIQDMLIHYPPRFTAVVEAISNKAKHSTELALKALKELLEESPLYRKTYQFQKPITAIDPESMRTPTPNDPILGSLFLSHLMQNLEPGANLCKPGDQADEIYILHKGRIGVFEDNQLLLQFKDQGDTLGTVKALSGKGKQRPRIGRRKRVLKTLVETELMILPSKALESTASDHPVIIVHICRSLARRLTKVNQEMTEALGSLDEIIKKLYGPYESVLLEVCIALENCKSMKKHLHLLEDQIQELEKIQGPIEKIQENFDELLVSVRTGSLLNAS
jgi:CRP-like cAMP-binding protein